MQDSRLVRNHLPLRYFFCGHRRCDSQYCLQRNRSKTTTQASTFAAKPLRYLTPAHLEVLQDGDLFTGGKLVDCDGEEIPVVPEEKLPEVREKIQCGEVTTTAEIAQVVVKDKQPTTSADSSEDRENGEASISQGRGVR